MITNATHLAITEIRKTIQCSDFRPHIIITGLRKVLESTCWLSTKLTKPTGLIFTFHIAGLRLMIRVLIHTTQCSPGITGRDSNEGPGEGINRTLILVFHFNTNNKGNPVNSHSFTCSQLPAGVLFSTHDEENICSPGLWMLVMCHATMEQFVPRKSTVPGPLTTTFQVCYFFHSCPIVLHYQSHCTSKETEWEAS